MTVRILAGGGGTQETDDDFNFVTTLLHADGSNGGQNNTFIDSSSNNLTVTPGSDVPIQGTFSPFSTDVGKWSIEMDGNNEYLEIDSYAGLGFGTGAYTIEMWLWKTIAGQANIYDGRDGGTTNRLLFYVNSANKLAVYENGAVVGTSSGDFPLNQWVHIALSRESDGTSRFWMNGAHQDNWSSSVNIAEPQNDLYVGRAYNSGSYMFAGYMSNLRVVKGTAVYTGSSAITVPTSPLTAITNTVLLTASSNTGQDRSTTGATICRCPVANGAAVRPFSPFKNSSEYSAATHGGSIFFEKNANSWLEVDHATLFDFGTADYCIEAWLYPTQTSFSNSWAMWFNTKGVNQYWAYTDGAGNEAGAGFSAYPSGAYSADNDHIIRPFAWHHCVFQVTGGYENWYLNGKRIYNVQNNPSYSASATGARIGNSPAYASFFYYGGYISDLRVTTGNNWNPYSNASTLTVPTAPLTSGSYTRLLLNGTNAAIIDSSGKNNIETVGNAQLDTSVKKFGTASAEFDGTGDYLVVPYSPSTTQLSPNYGPFTYECFVYPEASGQYDTIFDTRTNNPGADGIAVFLYGTRVETYWGASNTSFAVNSAVTLNQWQHFAITRDSSNNIRAFVNGTQIGSTQTSNTNFNSNSGRLVIGAQQAFASPLEGFIDEFRITFKARYTSNFTAPTKEFPNN